MGYKSHYRELMLSRFRWDRKCRDNIWSICRRAHHWLTPYSIGLGSSTRQTGCDLKAVCDPLIDFVCVS